MDDPTLRDPLLDRALLVWSAAMGVLACVVSVPAVGEVLFRGTFVQDADEVIRAWYGRCAFKNASVIPHSHLSMPGWTAVLALGEGLGRLLGLPLTLPGRLVSVAAGAWLLRNGAGLVRSAGGSVRLGRVAAALVACSPAFFLLTLTVYAEVAFAALLVAAFRAQLEGRVRAAALLAGLSPLVRWEGGLVLGLLAAVFASERRWRALLWLGLPYAAYLASNTLHFGDPLRPLANRTTETVFGAWRVLNSRVPGPLLREAAANLAILVSPVVLLGGLALAPWSLRHPRLRPLAFGATGLLATMLLIWHDTEVWSLRVFLPPTVLAVLGCCAAMAASSARVRRVGVGVLVAATLVTALVSWRWIDGLKIPAPGRFRSELGYHMVVRAADATEALERVHDELADPSLRWVLTSHMNANLLRADPTCTLYDHPLHLGVPRLSLTPRFLPRLALPDGDGLWVSHAGPIHEPGCTEVARFPEAGQWLARCRATTPPASRTAE